MNRTLAIVLSVFIPIAAVAQDIVQVDGVTVIRPADDSDLSEFLWTNRAIVVFADSPADPRFGEQMERLNDGLQSLMDRDVIILTDTDPSERSPVRTKLRPRGFQLVLVGKDGNVNLRKPLPLTAREITRSIDKTPERQREIDERRGS